MKISKISQSGGVYIWQFSDSFVRNAADLSRLDTSGFLYPREYLKMLSLEDLFYYSVYNVDAYLN